MANYEHVLALDAQGCNQTEIAEQLRMSRKKVRQLLKGPPQPPVYKQRSTKLSPYKSYLKRRFTEEGCDNSLQLYREVCSQGYDGCCSVITNYVTQLRQRAGTVAGTGVHQSTQPKPLNDNIPAPSQIHGRVSAPCGETDSQTTNTTPVAAPKGGRVFSSLPDGASIYRFAPSED